MKYWEFLCIYLKMRDWIFIEYCLCSVNTSNRQYGAYTWLSLNPEELYILEVPQHVTRLAYIHIS